MVPPETDSVVLCFLCPRKYCERCSLVVASRGGGAVSDTSPGSGNCSCGEGLDEIFRNRVGGGISSNSSSSSRKRKKKNKNNNNNSGAISSVPRLITGRDRLIASCQPCRLGEDTQLSAPTSTCPSVQGHLLFELHKHSLSGPFRMPVDVESNKGYQSAVSEDDRMDITTMVANLKRGRYNANTGRTSKYIFADLERLFANVRKFTGYAADGSRTAALAADGAVPAIVRSAFRLERLVKRYASDHMSGVTVPDLWLQDTWDPSPTCQSSWSLPENQDAASNLLRNQSSAASPREQRMFVSMSAAADTSNGAVTEAAAAVVSDLATAGAHAFGRVLPDVPIGTARAAGAAASSYPAPHAAREAVRVPNTPPSLGQPAAAPARAPSDPGVDSQQARRDAAELLARLASSASSGAWQGDGGPLSSSLSAGVPAETFGNAAGLRGVEPRSQTVGTSNPSPRPAVANTATTSVRAATTGPSSRRLAIQSSSDSSPVPDSPWAKEPALDESETLPGVGAGDSQTPGFLIDLQGTTASSPVESSPAFTSPLGSEDDNIRTARRSSGKGGGGGGAMAAERRHGGEVGRGSSDDGAVGGADEEAQDAAAAAGTKDGEELARKRARAAERESRKVSTKRAEDAIKGFHEQIRAAERSVGRDLADGSQPRLFMTGERTTDVRRLQFREERCREHPVS